jgi:hypothetical protein
MAEPQHAPPLTAADLFRAICVKLNAVANVLDAVEPENIAAWIRDNHLSTAIVPGTKPPLTFSAAFAHIFQRDLEGRPVRRKGAA